MSARPQAALPRPRGSAAPQAPLPLLRRLGTAGQAPCGPSGAPGPPAAPPVLAGRNPGAAEPGSGGAVGQGKVSVVVWDLTRKELVREVVKLYSGE